MIHVAAGDCSSAISEVLQHIEAGALLPPLVVLQTLAKNKQLKVWNAHMCTLALPVVPVLLHEHVWTPCAWHSQEMMARMHCNRVAAAWSPACWCACHRSSTNQFVGTMIACVPAGVSCQGLCSAAADSRER